MILDKMILNTMITTYSLLRSGLLDPIRSVPVNVLPVWLLMKIREKNELSDK